jgi:hypothetical protein
MLRQCKHCCKEDIICIKIERKGSLFTVKKVC